MSKPSPGTWLVLGGCGFIGRNLVKYLLDNNLASCIRVCDKRAPFMSFLSADHKAALLNKEFVEFVQADLSEDDMVDAAFAPPRGGAGGSWDYVVNLCAETKLGSKDEFFDKGVAAAGKAVEAAARAGGVRKFIHVSTAAVYKPAASAKGTGEGGALAPWSAIGEAALRSEESARAAVAVSPVPVPFIILRPAMCYGPGDVNSLMPRCVIAATYKATQERMDFLWDASVKVSTVSVFDVVRAIYFCARKAEGGAVFNLADKGDTDQGKIAAAIATIFSIETGFVGTIKSNLAALRLDAVVDAANEDHLSPWLGLLRQHSIANTPLSPYLHKSLLAHNHLCINGTAIEAIGFKYAVPELTPEGLKEPIALAIAARIFPPIF